VTAGTVQLVELADAACLCVAIGAGVLSVVALARGCPPAVAQQAYGLWEACGFAGAAICSAALGDRKSAAGWLVLAALAGWRWWQSRPPRPPRRRRVLVPARAGTP
jgi:multidrug transporter EmrE-like cation transporter